MPPLFTRVDFSGNSTKWLPSSAGWTTENTQKLLLMAKDEERHPLVVRSFGYEKYPIGKRVVRTACQYIVRYVVDGLGTFNGKPIERGCCYCSVPGRQYTIESDDDAPLVQYWYELEGARAPLYVERLLGPGMPGVVWLEAIDECEDILHSLLFEQRKNCKLSTYIYSVFFHLLAVHQSEKQEEGPIPKPMLMYLEAVDYIESHPGEAIRIGSLCDRLHIVPDYLYKIFKRYSGLSTQEYIVTSKMNAAAALLTANEYSVADVADMVGYADQGQFTKAFRRVFGVTPSEFRRKKSTI